MATQTETRLRALILPPSALDDATRRAMLAAHARAYANVAQERFFRDLDGKDGVILLAEPGGAVAGFSTFRLVPMTVDGHPTVFLFSGDTVVDRRRRQSPLLAGAFGHVMARMIDAFPEPRRFWFLVSKGHRTYRFLPLYFRRFHPSFREPTPPAIERARLAIGRRLFGNAYDAAAGIVRHAEPADRLTPEEAAITAARVAQPDVRFFLDQNPGHARGDELACIAEVAWSNLNGAARRVIDRAGVAWHEGMRPCFG